MSEFIVINKSNGIAKFKTGPDKEFIFAGLKAAEYDPDNFEVITPEEHEQRVLAAQDREDNPEKYQKISEAEERKRKFKEEHPTFSSLHPRTVENPNSLHAKISDALTIPGRGYAALLDGLTSEGDFLEEANKSLGEAEADERERGMIGGLAQGVLRDEMFVPGLGLSGGLGLAAPALASKIPALGGGIKYLNTPARTMPGKFAKGSLLAPMAAGLPAGVGLGFARPALTGEWDFATDIASGAGGNVAMHNMLGLAKVGLKGLGQGAKTLYNKLGGATLKARNDISRFGGKTPAEIIKDLEAEYGVKLDDWRPEMQSKIPERKTVYEIAGDAVSGDKIPTEIQADYLGNKSGSSKQALMRGTSEKGIADIEKGYRSQRDIADKIAEELSFDNLIGKEFEVWKGFLDNPANTVPEEKIYALFKALERPINDGLMKADELKVIGKYVKMLESRRGGMTAKELDNLRQIMDSDINYSATASDNKLRSIEEKALREARKIARDTNLEMAVKSGNPEAAEAYMKNAKALKLRDDFLHEFKADKGDSRDVGTKMASKFKNRGSAESNSPVTQSMYESLKTLDDFLGTDYAKQISDAYLANRLSPTGEKFDLPHYNAHHTGKDNSKSIQDAWANKQSIKSAYVDIGRRKANDIKGFRLGQAKAKTAGNSDLEFPARYWGNPFGGGKERDRLINSGALD